jgi:hypothetical protein
VRFQVLAIMSITFLGCDVEQFGREIPMFLQNPSTKLHGITLQKMVVLICEIIPEFEFDVRCGIPMLTQMKKH